MKAGTGRGPDAEEWRRSAGAAGKVSKTAHYWEGARKARDGRSALGRNWNWVQFRTSRLKMLEDAISSGKADEKAIPLLRSINKNESLVTTSSCSGRIVLLRFDIENAKRESAFYKRWHGKVDAEEVELALSAYADEEPLWFRVEPFILHVAAENLAGAQAFMQKMRKAGVKRGGIQSLRSDRVVVEVQGTTSMSFPVGPVDGEWDEILKIANRMMDANFKQLKKLEKIGW